MFRKGDKIHLHDGTVHRMKTDGLPPRRSKKQQAKEITSVRGFVRGALVDPDGTEHVGAWHENVVTVKGHEQIIRNFAGMASSAAAQWWGIGSHNTTLTTAQLQTMTRIDSEYGTNPSSAVNANGSPRAAVSASQAIAGSWTLSQSWQYPSNQIPNDVLLNCLAQHASSAISSGAASANPAACALSLATFSGSSKSNSQALNITYNWSFGT